MFTIYLRRNKVNGKCYVGQTSDFKQRETFWRCLNGCYANKHINNDRAEFGLENFTVEVLAECETREEAWRLEEYYINQYNSIWPNGYNLSTGGSGHSGCEGFWLGKHRSEETKLKMSETLLNREDLSKPVYQYTKEKKLVTIWASTQECGRNGYNQGNVSQCCNNCYLREGNNIYKNHIWSYTEIINTTCTTQCRACYNLLK